MRPGDGDRAAGLADDALSVVDQHDLHFGRADIDSEIHSSCCLQSQSSIRPAPIGATRFDHGFDEFHTPGAIFYGGHGVRQWISLATGPARMKLIGHVAIDLRETFEITLGMTRRNARRVCRRRPAAIAAARDQPWLLSEWREPQMIRVFLPKLQTGFAAIEPYAQAVLV